MSIDVALRIGLISSQMKHTVGRSFPFLVQITVMNGVRDSAKNPALTVSAFVMDLYGTQHAWYLLTLGKTE